MRELLQRVRQAKLEDPVNRLAILLPRIGDLQFMPTDLVEAAMERETPAHDPSDPLVIGVDVARHGSNETVIYPRIGYDARSFAPKPGNGRYRGLDIHQTTGRVIEVVRAFRATGKEVDALFVDEGGVGAGVLDNLRHLGYPVHGVQFGGRCIDARTYRFKVDEMWGRMREAMPRFVLPGKTDPSGLDLKTQLTQREFGYTRVGDKINLESKDDMQERLGGEAVAPDIADALACTFAMDVAPKMTTALMAAGMKREALHEFDPLDEKF